MLFLRLCGIFSQSRLPRFNLRTWPHIIRIASVFCGFDVLSSVQRNNGTNSTASAKIKTRFLRFQQKVALPRQLILNYTFPAAAQMAGKPTFCDVLPAESRSRLHEVPLALVKMSDGISFFSSAIRKWDKGNTL